MVIALQEVLSKNLQFHNGFYLKLLDSIKFILDNLQAAYTRNHSKLFQKTLQSLEIHLVNLTAQTEVYTSHYANLVSDNEVFESHLVNQPNITDELMILTVVNSLVNSTDIIMEHMRII